MHEHQDVINLKINSMADTIDRMSKAVEKISESMNRLVLAEERISHVVEMHSRMQNKIDEIEKEQVEMKIKLANSTRTVSIVDKFIWALAAASIIFVAVKTGLVG